MQVVPITQRAARAWFDEHHRHLKAPRGDIIRAAIERDGEIVAVASAGRPKARMIDDGRTLEITRVATLDNVPNACSMLYGALRRAGRALGWRRFVTYTLPEEGGASLRAAGWRLDTKTSGGEWSRHGRQRALALRPDPKLRWIWP